jgi:hypothetical protein
LQKLDDPGGAVIGLFQAHLYRLLHVGGTLTLEGPLKGMPSPAPEHTGQDVIEDATPESGIRLELPGEGPGPLLEATLEGPALAVLVVSPTGLGVGEDLIRLVYPLEPLRGPPVPRVYIGVILTGQPPEGALDLLIRCVLEDTQYLVIVLASHRSLPIPTAFIIDYITISVKHISTHLVITTILDNGIIRFYTIGRVKAEHGSMERRCYVRIFGKLQGRIGPRVISAPRVDSLETFLRICGDVYRFGGTSLRPF